MKPLVLHQRADEDVREAIQYLQANAPASALDFVDVLEQTFLQIQRHPATGSPRYAHELNLPDLRCSRLLKNVMSEAETRKKGAKKRSLHRVNEHFEPLFDAVSASAIVLQQPVRACKRFPYLVFYVESAQQIDVWRILHSRRDIPNWLQSNETEN